jgi:mRNA interferase HigB
MRVIARRTLKEFWERHPQAERPIRAWFAVVTRAQWRGPNDVKREFGTTVDFVADNRMIFDLGGNKYRLVVHASYAFGRVLVKSSELMRSTTASMRRPYHGEEAGPPDP